MFSIESPKNIGLLDGSKSRILIPLSYISMPRIAIAINWQNPTMNDELSCILNYFEESSRTAKKNRKFANEMHMSTSVKFSFLGENFSLFFKSFFTGESRLGLLFYLVTFPITSQLPEDSFPVFFIILEHDRDQSIKKVAELRCILHL